MAKRASGVEREGNIDHTAIRSAMHKTGGGYWTRSDEFCKTFWVRMCSDLLVVFPG